MPKRSCKFTEDLQNELSFLKKVCAGTGNQDQDDRVKCSHCNSEFSVAHGGRSDIKDHLQSTPLAQEELKEDLTKSNYVSVSMDASNRKDIKLLPIVVSYFNPNSGVQVKLLDCKSVAGEASEILTNHLCSVLLQNDLNNKLVGFCGDNCNTNYDGMKRAGQKKNRLKNSLGQEINGIGCGAHIVHNCVQTAVDSLPIDIEALLVKIYKYFHIYTIRVIKVNNFCEYAEIQYRKIIQHGNIRFLLMMPALERILQIFEGLKAFLEQEMCP
ncbi:hypothetical protein AVEN_267869-1 [Araneus ventricosus]|uniref:DUF4371 domain-containing protein n=1 Tax=Araneus ventricosus TaxID=182803 RepID=A0A4Y2RTY7_ARAVE|nr:hypothetical protein AVEN_122199-1 [Araneus ventricosus]GBN79191.1 hypothetical protein AVEN_267869-1 [Araneus ventricosus]